MRLGRSFGMTPLQNLSSTSLGCDHRQGGWLYGNLYWCLANKFAIGVDVEWTFGTNLRSGGGEIVDFFNTQVTAAVHGREHAEQLEGIDGG